VTSRTQCPALLLCGLAIAGGSSACDDQPLGLTPPYVSASAEKIDFGERVIGTADERTIHLINKGQVPLTLEVPEGDTRGGVFAVLLDNFTVQPNKDVVVAVGFRPADPTTYTATITISNNSANQPALSLLLIGKGIRPGPCDNVDCSESPAPTCISENTTRRYEPLGVCEDGRCVHNYNDDQCEFGCDDASGRCRMDPCFGMACNTPPNNCYFAGGTCEQGACRFQPNNDGFCDDSNVCTTGDHCSEGTCVGAQTTCNTPPDALCVDAMTRRVWSPQGACNPANGGCEYQAQDQHCQFGCDPAGCRGDPCAGITCDTPPSSQCYLPAGTCTNGQCVYTPVSASCDDGDACTTGDACNNGTCAGAPMVCNTPPGADCASANERRVYNPVGTCSAGQCNYASNIAICNDNNACTTGDACQSGNCVTSGTLGCNDGNACTNDSCDAIAGCVHTPGSGMACVTSSADCPTGTCSAGQCLATPGVTCVTEYQVDLCQEAEVAGVCSANGQCVVSQAPPGLTCPGCNGICLQCFFFQVCIPFGP
jgi:hypothetical protein